MPLIKSLVGKANFVISVVLVACFALLVVVLANKTSSRKYGQFTSNAEMLTAFLAEQVNTGTRLKRTAMIEPQVAAALDNTRVDVEAVRITHVDEQEVLSLQ